MVFPARSMTTDEVQESRYRFQISIRFRARKNLVQGEIREAGVTITPADYRSRE
jgi:hypothetical protein